MKFIFTHFEMGDSIICNGLVRNILKTLDEPITLFAKTIYKESMEWMYRDTSNLNLLFFQNYVEAEDFILKNSINPIRYGFKYITDHSILVKENCHFDEMFYKLANIPFHKRWDDFYVNRDLNKEYDFFKTFGIKEREYIFIHNTCSNEIPPFNSNVIINKHLTVINPDIGKTNNIFDYCYLIENASEIHCTCSSFKNLTDSLPNVKSKLFFHLNRTCTLNNQMWLSSCKLDWERVLYK